MEGPEVFQTIGHDRRATSVSSAARAAIVLAVWGVALGAPVAYGQQPTTDLGAPETAKVVGADGCAKCHGPELQLWMQTPHYRTFDQLHRTPEARAIADKLGGGSIKRNQTCLNCHYTQQLVRNRPRVVAGVSCESCHGAAKDWLELHADYGAPGLTHDTEPPEHRAQRRQASIAAGMNNPTNVYLIARQCLSCHTTPDERLVDVGGHKAGSPDFELVAWSQGGIRHNFFSGGGGNAPSPPERVRVMFVVGMMADLEYSLRAVALASNAGTFAQTAAARAASCKQRLWDVQRQLNDPRIAAALEPLKTLELRLGNSAAIAAAAETVGKAALEFSTSANGAEMAAIDRMLPPINTYRY